MLGYLLDLFISFSLKVKWLVKMKNETNIDSLLLGETRSRFCSLKQQLLLFFILNQGKAQQRGFVSAFLPRNTATLAGVGREDGSDE